MVLDVTIVVAAFILIGLAWQSLSVGSIRVSQRRTTEQRRQDQFAVSKRAEQEDAEYDAMTPAQRDAYYVHPNWWVRCKRFLRH